MTSFSLQFTGNRVCYAPTHQCIPVRVGGGPGQNCKKNIEKSIFLKVGKRLPRCDRVAKTGLGVYLQPVKSFNVPHKLVKKIAKNGSKIGGGRGGRTFVSTVVSEEDFCFSDHKNLFLWNIF